MPEQPTERPVWQDGHPLMEAIAATVWKHCEADHGSGIVIDDPRNIAAAAHLAVRGAARTASGQQPETMPPSAWVAASERAYRPVSLTGIRIDRLATTSAPAAPDSGQYPRQDGDTTVLGPEVFASSDGQVISWRGMNYVPQAAPAVGQQPETTPWTADGRHGPTSAEMRQAIAHAIHRYDNHHALSGNDMPSEHHYGEADAVLAVLAAPAVGQPAEAQATDRAAVLGEAADAIEAEAATGNLNAPEYGSHENVLDASALLRRMAEEARS